MTVNENQHLDAAKLEAIRQSMVEVQAAMYKLVDMTAQITNIMYEFAAHHLPEDDE